MEGRDAVEVRGERLSRVWMKWCFVKEGEFEVVLVVRGGGGGREVNENKERD